MVDDLYEAVVAPHNTPHITAHFTHNSPTSLFPPYHRVHMIDQCMWQMISYININCDYPAKPITHHALLSGAQVLMRVN